MKTRSLPYPLVLVSLLSLLIGCGSVPTTASPSTPPLGTVASPQAQDAWAQARSSLPADIALYRPGYVPERFGTPELLEAHTDQAYGAVYTIVYMAPGETLAFILNMGKGALGNFPPAERRETVTLLGQQAELEIATETHAIGVFWQSSGKSYQIKSSSAKMTTDEMKKIIASLSEQ